MASFVSDILEAITSSFTELSQAIIELIKDGFIRLFCEYSESQGVITITGLSPVAYYGFILMGISLVCGLVYFLVNLVRRSR